MADQLQLRGGTTTEHATFTGALREVTVDTTKDTVVVHDNATAGGHPLLREDLSNLPAGTIDDADISATAEIAVSKLADGNARQLLQTDSAGTGVEWTSNVDVPGTLDVTSAATFDSTIGASAGTASLPSITFTGDLNTGIYSPGADQVAISTNGNGRLFVDSAGNVGIGTTSPAAVLDIASNDIRLGIKDDATIKRSYIIGTQFDIAAEPEGFFLLGGYSESTLNRVAIGGSGTAYNAATSIEFFTASNTTTRTGTERARIDSSGRLLVGTSSVSIGTQLEVLNATGSATAFVVSGQGDFPVFCHNKATSGDNSLINFGTEASFTTRGSVTYNRAGGVVAYNTTSDYRAKTILGVIQNPGDTIDALKVYRGVMNGATTERPMLVAHEAQEVAPYCVTGEKDAVDDDGNPIYQQMDHQVLVPLLIAEIQQLRTRVAALEGA